MHYRILALGLASGIVFGAAVGVGVHSLMLWVLFRAAIGRLGG